MKNDIKVQARMPKATVEILDNLAKKWQMDRSKLIREILEAFCIMTSEEQTAFLKMAAERRFSQK
ncbi:ribbon-helix-helix protein, CopG family [candidate division KSB1 bacterium]|nr:ribbon-helix-helix protein, CopG family [candidate division KSB1 bacterium]